MKKNNFISIFFVAFKHGLNAFLLMKKAYSRMLGKYLFFLKNKKNSSFHKILSLSDTKSNCNKTSRKTNKETINFYKLLIALMRMKKNLLI